MSLAFQSLSHGLKGAPIGGKMNRRRIVTLGSLAMAFSLAMAGSVIAGTSRARLASFPVPKGSQPTEITLGPDGNVWYTIQNSSRIGRITPGGSSTTFRTLDFTAPSDIVAGPDGNLWF